MGKSKNMWRQGSERKSPLNRESSKMLNDMGNLNEIIFKISHGDSSTYFTYFVQALLMETVSAPECLRRKCGLTEKKCLDQKRKARSRMVIEGGHKVESRIMFVVMVLVLRCKECVVFYGQMGRRKVKIRKEREQFRVS